MTENERLNRLFDDIENCKDVICISFKNINLKPETAPLAICRAVAKLMDEK